jgi:hypothetical protein
MYDASDQYFVLFIVIALFLVPVLMVAIRRKLFRQFSFSSLVKVLNWALVIQVITEAILLAGSNYISGNNMREKTEMYRFADTFLGTSYAFTVIGMMIYLPSLLILNIINWIRQFSKRFIKSRKSK